MGDGGGSTPSFWAIPKFPAKRLRKIILQIQQGCPSVPLSGSQFALSLQLHYTVQVYELNKNNGKAIKVHVQVLQERVRYS